MSALNQTNKEVSKKKFDFNLNLKGQSGTNNKANVTIQYDSVPMQHRRRSNRQGSRYNRVSYRKLSRFDFIYYL
jgi:hypothetical protein